MASLSAVLLNLILRPRQPEAELEEDDGLNEEE
jgi:xanthine permease